MGQRSFVLYLARKGLAAVAIDEYLGETPGAEVVNYPSLTGNLLQETQFATSNPEVTFLNRSVNMVIATKPS
jgi:hypothetical protein